MFRIIEFARMMVGTKAISTLSTGYLNALEYAKERVQGTDLADFMDKAAPKVTITHHPDVRRSLMTQKAYAEGMRALVLHTASVQDAIAVKEANGEDASTEHALNDLLLPIVKGYGSEKGYEQLAQSLQTFGGSGFLQEYPIEQYIRDAKIDTLYEGTTAIQGRTSSSGRSSATRAGLNSSPRTSRSSWRSARAARIWRVPANTSPRRPSSWRPSSA